MQTDDALNGAAGGCAAGFVAGLRGELPLLHKGDWIVVLVEGEKLTIAPARSIPLACGACAGMATLIGTFNAAGNVSHCGAA